MTSITESDLILPALLCIYRADGPSLSTSDLSKQLRELLKPTGEDTELLANRNDDKFSQKVRNLRSHKTLEKKGVCEYENKGHNGYWTLTSKGKDYVEGMLPTLEYVLDSGFEYHDIQHTLNNISNSPEESRPTLFDEVEVVKEGQPSTKATPTYSRSPLLRKRAIEYFSVNNTIRCQACGFDFSLVYGEHGQGFIEIHHLKPVFMYKDSDVEKTIEEALENVAPLCANCHRMIHRNKSNMLSIEELKNLIAQQK